jgi:catechol 2,3-dioxygenase-like lactoylglutathione lyase family enzyme
MKKSATLLLTASLAFAAGVAVCNTLQSNSNPITMKRVTGIGGVFFKSRDPQKMREWYRQHLGLEVNPYGATFEWYERPDSAATAQTQWSPFPESTTYFAPSEKQFMINYRVENLVELVAQLKAEGVTVLDEIAVYDYGKFVHILDEEGNKIELWEPA